MTRSIQIFGIALFSLFTLSGLFAETGTPVSILENQGIFKERSLLKIEEMAGELKEATGVSYYLAAYTEFPEGKNVHQVAGDLESRMQSPWILLIFSAIDKQVDLKFSPGTEHYVDKNHVLDDFVIPIIVKKKKGLTDADRFEAGLFNGSTKIIADVAAGEKVTLKSIPKGTVNESETSVVNANFWKYSFYAFLLVTVGVVIWNARKRKKA